MISFITTFIPNPRLNKRIAIAKKHSPVSAICIDRSDNHLFSPAFDDITYRFFTCNVYTSKHFIKRTFQTISFYLYAAKEIRKLKPSVLYVQGLDCLFFAVLFSCFSHKKIIYEVSDIRECMLSDRKTFLCVVLSQLEKQFLKRVLLLVLTSNKFYDAYYQNKISMDKVLVIPNTPDLSVFSNYKKTQHEHFTIGFIGGIRYLAQLKLLVDAAKDLDIHILFAGGSFVSEDEIKLKEYCENRQNISFWGRFEYNKEIAQLYEKVDCIYSVYDADNFNCKIALPNKLYESVYCELPIIVAKGTYLSSIVEKYQIGASVSHVDESDLREFLDKMVHDKSFYLSLTDNCKKYKDEILQSNIYSVFENKITSILNN